MRRLLPLLALAALACALTTAPAHAARCPKGTTTVGPKTKPTACVPKQRPDTTEDLQRLAAKLHKAPKGARKASRRARRLLVRAHAFAQQRSAAGEPLFTTEPAKSRLRGSGGQSVQVTNAPASFGEQITASEGPGGSATATFEANGVRLQMTAERNGSMTIDVRDKSGAGGAVSYNDPPDTPRCPTAAGDVPTDFGPRMTITEATSLHGKRQATAVTMIADGAWHGYVGVGGKAERFDVSLRTALEVRVTVTIASTGKLLHREPTRTYRAAVDRKGLPVGTAGEALYGDMRVRGPKGKRGDATDRAIATSLVQFTASMVDSISSALKSGDERWYDRRMCATHSLQAYSPSEVTKGATATWTVRATTARGEDVADAQWTPASSCGVLNPIATRGPVMQVSVTDAAGQWGPDPARGACVTAEVTTTAGRAAPFSHDIPPALPADLRIGVTITYNENMGSGITETNMTGSGAIELPWNATDAEGTGAYSGTEWDGKLSNPCGEDMLASRGFSGTATVGVHRNTDGTLSVMWTANERPLRMSFLRIVTPEGGGGVTTAAQPFCGQAGLAKTTADMKVTVTRAR